MTKVSVLSHPRILRRLLLAASTCALFLGLFGGIARASSPIEGIWSFGGGAVAIQPAAGGGYEGTVVAATTFAVCEHPVGQALWTGIQEQPDGSFFGLHLWYHGSNCEIVPDRGLNAFRVITSSTGERTLLVCLSNPGDDSQPTIGPEGKTAGDTYGCLASAPLAPLPGSSGTGGGGSASSSTNLESVLTTPSPTTCQRSLTLVPHAPKYNPLKKIIVRVNGKKVATIASPEKLTKKIVLKNLPEGTFRVRITAETVLKQRFSKTRKYQGCSQKVKVRGPRGPGHS